MFTTIRSRLVGYAQSCDILVGSLVAYIPNGMLFVVIVLSGLLLRIYNLGTESLWVDEITSVYLAHSNIAQIIADRSQSVNPPLYFALLHAWVQFFGDSEVALRLPSAIFSIAAIIMMYHLGLLIWNKQVGLIASLLLSISSFHLYYAQEARGYSLMSLLTLLSMYFFIKMQSEKKNRAIIIEYIVSSILLMYTHFYEIMIIAAQNGYIIIMHLRSKDEKKIDIWRWAFIQIIIAALYLPWLGFLIKQFINIQSGYWIPKPDAYSLLETFLAYSAYSKILLLFFAGLILLAIIDVERMLKFAGLGKIADHISSRPWGLRRSSTNKSLLLVTWLSVPIVLSFCISQFSTPIYYTRYTIGASLAYYLLSAIGIQKIKSKNLRIVIIAVIMCFFVRDLRDYYIYDMKNQWREAAEYVDAHADPGDLLIFNEAGQSDIFGYYTHRSDVTIKGFDLDTRVITEQTSQPAQKIGDLDAVVQGYRRVWLLLAESNDTEGLIKHQLTEQYNLSLQDGFTGIKVYLFVR